MTQNNNILRIYLQPAFLLCIAILGSAALLMPSVVEYFGIQLKKEPLPIAKSLNLLDETKLAPYKVVSKLTIANDEIVETLGTEEYLQLILEDIDEQANSPYRKCMLFVTYYEQADEVPHVPEECYTGSGYQKMASDNITFEISRDANSATETIPGRYVVFAGTSKNYWQAGTKFSILYLFNVNRSYAATRTDARVILNTNIFGKGSYFSKVEWWFMTKSGSRTFLNAKEATKASEKLLSVVLPVLENEHWPDMQKSADEQALASTVK